MNHRNRNAILTIFGILVMWGLVVFASRTGDIDKWDSRVVIAMAGAYLLGASLAWDKWGRKKGK